MAGSNGCTIGVPAEVKDRERRVALTPSAVRAAVDRGHDVLVEEGAGSGAGFGDVEYKEAGAEVVSSADEVWASDVVVKVKEPQPAEFEYFRPDLSLFTYLHLATVPAIPRVTRPCHRVRPSCEDAPGQPRSPGCADAPGDRAANRQ